ncbi:hypothetical protein [Actinomadura atramentaria]|uniref:hypothetical protein n=1 Tax=Actinomadura atramentaria TaxID=1990 RepID=UPI00035D67E4|nr:hypothetical protein [Actinomadura atramentaria]
MDTTENDRAAGALRATKLLTASYLALSVLTVAAVAALRDHHAIVDDAVWTRGVLVAVGSALTFRFAVRAARGVRAAYRRLRITSAVMLAAVVVIVALPGLFPVWFRVEQAACGLLLLGIVAFVNGGRLRARFAAA